jgi:hypothetical protein
MDAVEKSTVALKEALTVLDAEKARLEGELAVVNAKHKALSTAVAALDPDSAAPKRRRGRPKKAATIAAEAVTA